MKSMSRQVSRLEADFRKKSLYVMDKYVLDVLGRRKIKNVNNIVVQRF